MNKSLVLTLSTIAYISVSSASYAASFNDTGSTNTQYAGNDLALGSNIGISGSEPTNHGAVAIDDITLFSVAAPSNAVSNGFNIGDIRVNKLETPSITDFNIQLDSVSYSGTGHHEVATYTEVATDAMLNSNAGVDLVAGQQYALVVTGETVGGGANYSGSVSISAVPLPAALPMFGGGLVSLGALVRRRRTKAIQSV